MVAVTARRGLHAPRVVSAIISTVDSSERSRLPLPASAALAAVLLTAAIALIAFYVPTDADQGLSQKIFYFHVPIALTAYACFGWGAWKALRVLWKRDERADLESYVAIHKRPNAASLPLPLGSAKWNTTSAATTNRSIAGSVSRARSSRSRSLRASALTSET